MRFSLRHFTEVFNVKSESGSSFILIGGQAVNYWAEYYLTREPELEKWQPFTSEDIDFHGSPKDVRRIANQLGLVPVFPRAVEMTALAGMIPFKRGGILSQIEVVTSVPGVPTKLLQSSALEITWEQYQIRVIDPISLLCGKARLVLKISQAGRRDASHLAIMILCVRGFLREAVLKVGNGSLPARNWLAAAERVLKVSESTTGAKTSRRFGINWRNALPIAEIGRSSVPQIVKFKKDRIPRWEAKIAQYVLGNSAR